MSLSVSAVMITAAASEQEKSVVIVSINCIHGQRLIFA